MPWLKAVEIVEAEKTSETTARVLYRFPVQRAYLNPAMTLHGGQMAAIYDIATSWLLALIRKPGFWQQFGISSSLSVKYMRPAMEGEVLLLETEVSFRLACWWSDLLLIVLIDRECRQEAMPSERSAYAREGSSNHQHL